jgi:hypothetical protein
MRSRIRAAGIRPDPVSGQADAVDGVAMIVL